MYKRQLKYGSLEGALESIQKATGEHTAIMSLMNGIDSEEIIGRTVGMEHVLPALIKVASHKEEDGYHFDPPTTLGIIFGEPSAPCDSERVKAVEELFADTGIHFRSTEYIQEEIWCKSVSYTHLLQSASGFQFRTCNSKPCTGIWKA